MGRRNIVQNNFRRLRGAAGTVVGHSERCSEQQENMLSLSALCLAQQHSSVRYDPASHVAKGSSGCGSKSPYPLGKTTVATGEYAGVKWTFRVYVPSSYDKSTPVPLVLQHPGWGMSAQQEEKGAGITTYAEKEGFISVTPQGMNDNPNYGGPWYSWNAVGSTQSPGPAGATCTSAANYPSYCYTSCPDKAVKAGLNGTKHDAISGYSGYSYGSSGKNCDDSPQCWWTTCDETVTPTGTGTSKVGGFIPGLYDTLEQQLCIDLTREYGSGESNGGMQTYQIGVDLHARLAAITPEVCTKSDTPLPYAPRPRPFLSWAAQNLDASPPSDQPRQPSPTPTAAVTRDVHSSDPSTVASLWRRRAPCPCSTCTAARTPPSPPTSPSLPTAIITLYA